MYSAAEYELQKMSSRSADCLEENESEIGTLKAQVGEPLLVQLSSLSQANMLTLLLCAKVEERSTRVLALTSELSEALNEQHRLK